MLSINETMPFFIGLWGSLAKTENSFRNPMINIPIVPGIQYSASQNHQPYLLSFWTWTSQIKTPPIYAISLKLMVSQWLLDAAEKEKWLREGRQKPCTTNLTCPVKAQPCRVLSSPQMIFLFAIKPLNIRDSFTLQALALILKQRGTLTWKVETTTPCQVAISILQRTDLIPQSLVKCICRPDISPLLFTHQNSLLHYPKQQLNQR